MQSFSFHRAQANSRPSSEPHPFFGRAFRPFFLSCSLLASLSVAIWLFVLAGYPVGPSGFLAGIPWHIHTMVFHFATGIIVGFLLTAAPNWTGAYPLRGMGLIVIYGLWLFSVVLPFFGLPETNFFLALLGSLWLFLAGAWTAKAVFTPPSKVKNHFAAIVLILFGIFELLDLWQINIGKFDPTFATIDVVLFVMTVLGGRVIPFFTSRAAYVNVKATDTIDNILLVSLVLGLILAHIPLAFGYDLTSIGYIFQGLTGVLLLYRMKTWHTLKTLDQPLLWILHLGHALLAVPLLLRLATVFGVVVSRTVIIHSITTGALSFLVLGMISRVTRGHSGNPLIATKPVVFLFFCLIPIFIFRVIVPAVKPELTVLSWHISGGLFSLIWLIWAFLHFKICIGPRPDGAPA